MKIKAVKYNSKGLTRAENTVPRFVMPNKDLTKSNSKITIDNHYISVVKVDK